MHFHVPIFLDHFALIHTTQDQIGECLAAIKPQDEINHFEVETYAWDVLPEDLRTDGPGPRLRSDAEQAR